MPEEHIVYRGYKIFERYNNGVLYHVIKKNGSYPLTVNNVNDIYDDEDTPLDAIKAFIDKLISDEEEKQELVSRVQDIEGVLGEIELITLNAILEGKL